MADDTTAQETDEDGLIIHKHSQRVLVILPEEGIGDQVLRYARSSLHGVHVGTTTVAPSEVVTGRLQDEFTVDGTLSDASIDDYVGILVAGCEGDHPLATDEVTLGLVRQAAAAGKLVAAWGNGLEVLARAGVVKGTRVTGAPSACEAVRAAGGKYTGRQIEVASHTVTGLDESSGMRFGQALTRVVGN